jgi:hypothetical protein
MSRKDKKLPEIADPTIETVLQQYLDEAQAAKQPAQSNREEAIDLGLYPLIFLLPPTHMRNMSLTFCGSITMGITEPKFPDYFQLRYHFKIEPLGKLIVSKKLSQPDFSM